VEVETAVQKKRTGEDIFTWSLPRLSEKMKFAIKAALSLVLVYLISFSQGWSSTTTAATTIMLIAAIGSVGDSVTKGMLRVIGTVMGALIGMVLIALLPQDRMLYLWLLSLLVTLSLYLARAYKGDTTIFMLTAITMMTMFKGGEVDDVFLYGVNKTFMTVFGIAIYTLVGVLLWPVSLKDESIDDAKALTQKQKTLYCLALKEKARNTAAEQAMITQLQTLNKSALGTTTMESGFSRSQWKSILHDYRHIGNLLTLLSYQSTLEFPKPLEAYIGGYNQLQKEIERLFDAIGEAWEGKTSIEIPEKFQLQGDETAILSLTQLQRATLSSILSETKKLHTSLQQIAHKLNSLNSTNVTHFEQKKTMKDSSFLWLAPEDLKGALISFLVFWTAVILWIMFNPPGGFYIVTMATGLSLITTFSPVKPSLLLIVFTLSFLFAAIMYIFLLPHCVGEWGLSFFLFAYGFIGFYFINPKISIFFLLGIATFNITNQMYYSFDGFLMTLFMFYAFLFLLLFFYYFPFSTKPEHLFLTNKQRFFTLSQTLVSHHWHHLDNRRIHLFQQLKGWYAKTHLIHTLKSMQLWSSQIDEKYFSEIEKRDLVAFTQECEVFANLLLIISHNKQKENRLLKAYISHISIVPHFINIDDAPEEKVQESDAIVNRIEKSLTHFFASQDLSKYSKDEVIDFYERISMHKNSWRAFFSCQKLMREIDFNVLKESRF